MTFARGLYASIYGTMSDDEEDYMSDAFLASVLPKQDVRPGLKRVRKKFNELLFL